MHNALMHIARAHYNLKICLGVFRGGMVEAKAPFLPQKIVWLIKLFLQQKTIIETDIYKLVGIYDRYNIKISLYILLKLA